ncbi:hypothetical protein ASZ90_019770 [hydrocarbon metagenome]|uniref:Metal-binding protein n=1 Tax=hydrocarbon metagenome TaxID=938273 RepID=A0A0W8E2K7_9ZZZZ
MWYIYTSQEGNNYPLEFGYRAIETVEIIHNYEKVTDFCRNGCDSYGSGGCPPWAPRFADIQTQYTYGVLVFAKFFSRYKPAKFARCDIPYLQYGFQDIILSSLFTKLGYQVKKCMQEDVLFLNSGHCMGCGLLPCSFLKGDVYCRNPQRRTFAIGATGVEAVPLLQSVFGINLEWYENQQEVNCITKTMGFFCRERSIQNQIMDKMVVNLNSLPCSRFEIPGKEYRTILNGLLSG